MSNTSEEEFEIVFENIVPATGASVIEKGRKESSPAVNIPRVSVEQAQKIKSETSEYLKLQIGQLKTKYARQSAQKRQLKENNSSLKLKSVKYANGITRKNKIDQIRCSEKDSIVPNVSSTTTNRTSREANETKSTSNVCVPTDAEKNDSIVQNFFPVTTTASGEANICNATAKFSVTSLGGNNNIIPTSVTQSKTNEVGNEFVIQSEFSAPSSSQNVRLGKRQLQVQNPNLKLKSMKYANEITREDKTNQIYQSGNDNTVVHNVSPTASDRTNREAGESRSKTLISISPDHAKKSDIVANNIFPLTPIKTSGEVIESNASAKLSASPLAGKNQNVLHNAASQSKTNGLRNECVVQSRFSVSSPTQQNIKLSRELFKHPNKFCINGSPASSPKNRNFYSNGKKTPKSGNHTPPLTFMRSKFGEKQSPDVRSVKRKLNFSNGSLGLNSSQGGDSFSSDKNPLDGEAQPLSQMDLGNSDHYLLRQLRLHVDIVVSDNNSQILLSDEEIGTVQNFFTMNSECQDLYARMHNRKYKWTRLSDIRYASAKMENVNMLQDYGFLVTDMQNVGMVCLLDLLKFQEVKEICKSLGIKCSVQNKKCYSEEIIRYCQQQRTINFKLEVATSEEVVRKKAEKILGLCFKLSPEPRGLFRRIHLLFNLKFNRNEQSRYGSQDLFEIQFVGTEKALYPNYKIDETAKIFSSRDDLVRFQIAEDLKAEFFLIRDTKDWNKAETVLRTVRSNFLAECGVLSVFDESTSRISALDHPLSLRKFTPGTVYAYILSEGVDMWKKLKKREEAIDDLSLLLDQTVYLPYMRGRWYEKLITIYRTAGQLMEVAKTIRAGMNDTCTDDQGSYVMSNRCREILKRKKGVQLEVKEMLRDIPLFADLASVEPTEVKACALDGKAGYKRVYIQEDETGDGKTYSSVEELVRSHYCPRIYKHGIHSENSLVSSLFGILFWDVIYEYYVPNAFISPYQTRPLDLSTGEFYKNRKTAIDAKLVEMSKWTDNDIASWTKEIYDKQFGKTSVVYWNWFRDSKCVTDIIICVGLEIILPMCERFAKKYRGVRSGFPDLFLWTPGQKRQYKFVEVKGPNDKLGTNQKLWLDFLVKINANVEVCFVQAQGSKKTKASTVVEPCSPKNGNAQGGMETVEALSH